MTAELCSAGTQAQSRKHICSQWLERSGESACCSDVARTKRQAPPQACFSHSSPVQLKIRTAEPGSGPMMLELILKLVEQ